MPSKLHKRVWHAVKQNFITDDVFWNNEVEGNRFTAHSMLLFSGLLMLSWLLNSAGVFDLNETVFGDIVFWSTLELVVPAMVCLYFNGAKRWLKYLLMLELTVVLARVDSVLSYNVELMMLIPLFLSCRYFSHEFTIQISVVSTILFAISSFCGAWFDMAEYNLMYQASTKVLYTWNVMAHFFMPKWLVYFQLSIIAAEISKLGKKMVLKQADISREHSRVETELDMARRIQNRALPIVHTLPHQEKPLFDLAATMEPAREVGGDFYDFFYQDETHLVLMIADVSGKGVPAALFMIASKLLLDNSIASGKTPGKVLEEVNRQLCEKNMENMFVTVWLGILDLETGDIVTANAGHEYPLLCRKDGSFEIVKDKHGFVLGGMEGMRYKETTLHLDPGDTLFVYTDGVPEATNPVQEQFGMRRTMDSLNSHRGENMEDMTKNLKADIDVFADQSQQFDDTTMLALRMLEYAKRNEFITAAEPDSVERTEEYVRQILENADVPIKCAHKANIIVDEIYSNIVYYSGASWACVRCTDEGGTVVLEFLDNGTRYDPTQARVPDITASLEEREIGGLGILMTRKLADSMEYRYENEKNHLTVRLNYES